MNCNSCKQQKPDDRFKNCEGCRKKKYDKLLDYYNRNPEVYERCKSNDRKRMTEKRQTPEFRAKEALYLAEYCQKKGLTYQELWKEITDNH